MTEPRVRHMTQTRSQLESFGKLLTDHQSRLYAFVFTLVADAHLAYDALQETNRVLWENASEFDPEQPFLPWAFAVARNQVRTARQTRARSRLAFDEDVVERLADRATERAEQHGYRQIALAECLQAMSPKQRDLVTRRYQDGESVQDMAKALGRTASSLGVTMHRVRKALAICIDGALQRGVEA